MRILGVVFLACLLFVALPTYALWKEGAFKLENLCKDASHIVIGKVVKETLVWVPLPPSLSNRTSAGPWVTDVTLSVQRYIKGPSRGDTLVIRMRKGRVKIPPEGITLRDGQVFKPGKVITLSNGEKWRVPESMKYFGGDPHDAIEGFKEDEHVLVFLRENTEKRIEQIRKELGEKYFDRTDKYLYKPDTFKWVRYVKYRIEDNQAIGSGHKASDLPMKLSLKELINKIEQILAKQPTGLKKANWGKVKKAFILSSILKRNFAIEKSTDGGRLC